MILLLFFNATTTTVIYTLSLHDALPICTRDFAALSRLRVDIEGWPNVSEVIWDSEWVKRLQAILRFGETAVWVLAGRSEEHTSELQSLAYLVCRLLLEKKKKKIKNDNNQ